MSLSAPKAPEIRILGLRLDNVTLSEAIAAIQARVDEGTPTRVGFVNAHCVNVAVSDPEYRRALEGFDLVFADGSGVRLAGQILGAEVRDNVNGTDLFPPLCASLERSGQGVFFLGAAPGVAERMVVDLRRRYPRLVVAGVHHGYFGAHQVEPVLDLLRGSGARLLLVAMGVPQQEKWIERHHAACGIPVVMGVGGLFDFYSGLIPRAPLWLRRRGLEWTWRLAQEPRRLWRRYLVGNWTFLGRVALARLAGRGADDRGVR